VRKGSLLWLESQDDTLSRWAERTIAKVPDARTQGYAAAQLEPGGKPELIFTRGSQLSYVRIPAEPERDRWPLVVVSTETEEEGLAPADVDRDGDLDLFATAKGGQRVLWFENPGNGQRGWATRTVGPGGGAGIWLDRISAGDVNNDGRVDVVATEETQDWRYNAAVYWFEAPADARTGPWTRHPIALLRSANSLDLRDMDGDGDLDVVTAEHTDMRGSLGAPNNLTVIFENVADGRQWRPHPVEAGPHSSHLGAHAADLDGNGMLDIVSLGWNQYRFLHLWYR
jgi:hypothetical protein